IRSIHYGRLERVLVCQLNEESIWKTFRNSTLLLALITPAATDGQDATMAVTHFSHFTAPIITDTRSIKAAIGRVQSRKKWGVIDRTPNLAQVVFAPEAVDNEPVQSSNESS
ncbi:hypothetical protein BS17DRAFT_716798, partial [Gyrodon lividus]